MRRKKLLEFPWKPKLCIFFCQYCNMWNCGKEEKKLNTRDGDALIKPLRLLGASACSNKCSSFFNKVCPSHLFLQLYSHDGKHNESDEEEWIFEKYESDVWKHVGFQDMIRRGGKKTIYWTKTFMNIFCQSQCHNIYFKRCCMSSFPLKTTEFLFYSILFAV